MRKKSKSCGNIGRAPGALPSSDADSSAAASPPADGGVARRERPAASQPPSWGCQPMDTAAASWRRDGQQQT